MIVVVMVFKGLSDAVKFKKKNFIPNKKHAFRRG